MLSECECSDLVLCIAQLAALTFATNLTPCEEDVPLRASRRGAGSADRGAAGDGVLLPPPTLPASADRNAAGDGVALQAAIAVVMQVGVLRQAFRYVGQRPEIPCHSGPSARPLIVALQLMVAPSLEVWPRSRLQPTTRARQNTRASMCFNAEAFSALVLNRAHDGSAHG